MGFFSFLIIAFLGTVIFIILNSIFNIMYFGGMAIFGTWFASCFVGLLLIEVIIDHWIISTIVLGGGLILALKKYF